MNIVSVADIGINAAERLLKKKAFDENYQDRKSVV